MTDRERQYLAALERLVDSTFRLALARGDDDDLTWVDALGAQRDAMAEAEALIAQARKEQE